MPAKEGDSTAAEHATTPLSSVPVLIGLASAWRAEQHGLSVLVVDRAPTPGDGASRVAAGMLAR